MAQSTFPKRSVFVTGANGYIGSAVCRAFVRAGWRVYGLIRRPEAAGTLYSEETTPIIGSISTNATFPEALAKYTKTLDVIVSCTEQVPFGAHYDVAISLIRKLAATSNANGIRPLVLASSGCKDYGTTGIHGSPSLAPHTEASPLQPMDILKERAFACLKIFEHEDLFDAALLRPTPVYGYDSSYYGLVFELAAAAAQSEPRVLEIPFDFATIIHGCHIDDCAEAYVALAAHADRDAVAGQCFNISAGQYETLAMIADALKAEYGLRDVVRAPTGVEADLSMYIALGHSQWVDSSKIRRLTGWTDKRLPFWEGLPVYRMAYEEAARRGHEGVLRVKERFRNVLNGTKK
ncbi:NAD(P)-binding protein [Daldinia decipiens]|uniref:NAD(P)-binding protein n=1 Tax=Daldinia decipiens TaxID=326647 RepID=UPI0020C2D710|nr:NAD(P)-binding protein [Daldinia decipiens]KAI1652764.1 NAD(P)-binding protein [Daldinia decipiens]